MSGVRTRTLARLRTLAAAGAASAACHGSGYGVVDPMPLPSCFENPQPTAQAKLVERPARFVEIDVSYLQKDVTIGDFAAVDQTTGQRLTVAERAVTANGVRLLVEAPPGTTDMTLRAPTTCAAGEGRFYLNLSLTADAVTVEVR